MRFTSPRVAINALRRRPRFRLDVFLVRMWRLWAWPRFTSPRPVSLKRFRAPLWDFIFGIVLRSLVVRALLRRDDHRHQLSFQPARALDLSNVGELRGDAIQHGLSELRMRDLPTTEHHGHLHLVLLFQEPPRVSRLGLEIVLADART